MRHQCFSCHAAIDRPLRRRRLDYRILAGTAGVARTAHHLDAQLGRNLVEHLTPVLADHVQRTATTGTLFALDVDDDLVARQVGGQCTAIAVGRLCTPPSFRRLCCVFGGGAFGSTLLLILQDEVQLFEVKLFRTPTEAVAQQTLDQLP